MPKSLRQFRCVIIACLLLVPAIARAHVGSPDVVVQAQAGPYALLISVEPPEVAPGVAQIQVQSNDADITSINVAPTPLTGEGALYPPVADQLERAPNATAFYSGTVWIMSAGTWQLHINVEGRRGGGTISIPVPSTPTGTLPMPPWLMLLLGLLGAVLLLGMAAMIGAALREALLPPGEPPSPANIRRARIGMGIALLLLISIAGLGAWWWVDIANSYRANLYKPLKMTATLGAANQLRLEITDPNTSGAAWLAQRSLDDLLPDHGHVMHLYMVREPQYDVVLHLHPTQTGAGEFVQTLPPMPSGEYQLFADIVHSNGFAETITGEIGLPLLATGERVHGDDAIGVATPLNDADWLATSVPLPDGYTMTFDRPQSVQRGVPVLLHFELLDAKGKPAPDSVDYMGMRGHAAIIKADGTVFAHIHPFGSASMAALMIANPAQTMPGMKMDAMTVRTVERPANIAVFPYAFPQAGSYRVIVQMKHGDTVETGAFDVAVD